MTNQFNYDLTLQTADINDQPEQLSNEQLEGVAGGGYWLAMAQLKQAEKDR